MPSTWKGRPGQVLLLGSSRTHSEWGPTTARRPCKCTWQTCPTRLASQPGLPQQGPMHLLALFGGTRILEASIHIAPCLQR